MSRTSILTEWRCEWVLFVVSVSFGLMVFPVGFRLTFEVLPVLGALVIGSLVFGFLVPRYPWLWGLGIGIGTLLPTHFASPGFRFSLNRMRFPNGSMT